MSSALSLFSDVRTASLSPTRRGPPGGRILLASPGQTTTAPPPTRTHPAQYGVGSQCVHQPTLPRNDQTTETTSRPEGPRIFFDSFKNTWKLALTFFFFAIFIRDRHFLMTARGKGSNIQSNDHLGRTVCLLKVREHIGLGVGKRGETFPAPTAFCKFSDRLSKNFGFGFRNKKL